MMLNSVWLELYLFSFAANVLIALQLFAGKWIGRRFAIQLLSSILALGSLLILTVDGINLLNGLQYRRLQPWGYFPLLGSAFGLSWLSIRTLCFAKSRSEVRVLSLALSAALVLLNCWSWQRINTHTTDCEFSLYERTPGTLVEETRVNGYTRSGSPIPLFRLDVKPEDFSLYAAAIKERNTSAADAVIDVDDPNMEYNCHGWVFTGGKHFLRGSEVEVILKENGYSAISQPKENDIVIYRSIDGRILHTGLVRAIIADGTIIIESKWGAAGRYLHLPENQPYSTIYQYYRGCGPSHVIQIQELQSPVNKELPSKLAALKS